MGGPEATGKGFGRAWVGSGAAGDPDLGPTWAQLEGKGAQHDLCWCLPSSTQYNLLEHLKVIAGTLMVSGPVLGQTFNCVKNLPCNISLVGFYLQNDDVIEIVDVGSSCGDLTTTEDKTNLTETPQGQCPDCQGNALNQQKYL